MPRSAAPASIDEIIQNAVSGAMARLVPKIAKAIADAAASRLARELTVRGAAQAGKGRLARRRRPAELTKWVADNRARRVPTFVIEMTGGLDTKKKIVARYGKSAAFEKGKPLPKVARAA
jgi:hypothetical protein